METCCCSLPSSNGGCSVGDGGGGKKKGLASHKSLPRIEDQEKNIEYTDVVRAYYTCILHRKRETHTHTVGSFSMLNGKRFSSGTVSLSL